MVLSLSGLTRLAYYLSLIAVVAGLFVARPDQAAALEIKDAAVEIRNDFVLEPAKTELVINPGGTASRTVSVVNRTDREMQFNVEIEDFAGSRNTNQSVVLLGNDRGPYSLKDYIKPEVKTFKLKPRQRAIVPVTITIPADAEPGGLYGSLLVSTAPASSSADEGDSAAKTISRIGALYFVRVAGPVKEDGRLADFRLAGESKSLHESPFTFELLFANDGNVHLTPSGRVEIKNMFGRKVKQLDILPFFSLPDSLRAVQLTWDNSFAFGRYTATAYMDRNYQANPTETDQQQVVFWVLPWKVALALLAAVIILAFVVRYALRTFEIKRRGR